MQKRFLGALICVAVTLAVVLLTMTVLNIPSSASDEEHDVDEAVSYVVPNVITEMQATITKPIVENKTPLDVTKPAREQSVVSDDVSDEVSEETEQAEQTDTYEPEPEEELAPEPEPEPDEPETNTALYSASEFRTLGVIQWNGWRWTWYSERVLPGGGLNIPGRHNDENGYVCDENDYICLSSSTLSKGTVIDTPFGKQGKVYDTGCAADIVDVYVGW